MVFFTDPLYVDRGATISADGHYRYRLWREWRGTHDPAHWRWFDKEKGYGTPLSCLFIMLNPSTADALVDDPTVRRCVAFAKSWKYERLEVVNLFAYRATKPEELLALLDKDEPVGVDNLRTVQIQAAQAGLIVCAWGAHGSHMNQAETLLGWIDAYPRRCLGVTASGQPRHPLYIAGNTALVPYKMS